MIALADEMEQGKKKRERVAAERVPIPITLDCAMFNYEWDLWCKFRRSTKRSLSPAYIKGAFEEMAGWGVERAVAAMRHSRAKGYHGIFEPKESAWRAKEDADKAVAIRVD